MEKEMLSFNSSAPEVEHGYFTSSRRRLLKGILGLLSALGLSGLCYSLYSFLAPTPGEQRKVEIGLGEIPPGGTYPLKLAGIPGLLIHEEDGNWKAFSLICTHMACIVTWQPERKEFFCPCHDGYFDAEGRVISGPPPAPLERWPVEVREDRVLVRLA